MKYILIGLGSLVGVSSLVWIGTQNTLPVDHASVAQQPEKLVKELVPRLEPTSTVHAHSSAKDHTNDPVKAKVLGDKSVVNDRKDRVSKKGHMRQKTILPSSRKEPGFVVSEAEERATLVIQQDESPAKKVVATRQEDLFREEDLSNESISKQLAGPTVKKHVEESTLEFRASEEELIAAELIALPTHPNTMPKDMQKNHVNDPMIRSIEDESGNERPRIMANTEPTAEQATPEMRQTMMSPNDEDGYKLEEIGVRGGFNAQYVAIPPTEKEDFEQFDVFGAISFPKRYNYDSGWEIRFRMNGSLGVLRSGRALGFIGTISPGIVFWYPEWKVSINGGPGVAYVSREKYGRQDLGGPIQIVGHGGLTYYVTEHVGIGWRFHHISDAGIWGSDNRGVDVNMFELTYKF